MNDKGFGPKILELRKSGYSYNKIAKKLGCSKATISYHCDPEGKNKYKKRLQKNKINGLLARRIWNFGYAITKERKTAEKSVKKIRGVLTHKITLFQRGGARMFSVEELLNYIGENPVCYITGDPIDISDTKSWHLDHIIPVSKGGTADLSNVGIATRDANLFKSDNTLDELEILCQKFLTKRGYTIEKK